MKEVVQTLIMVTFVVGLIVSFILNSSTGLMKDMKDIKTSALSHFMNMNTSITP